MNIAAQQELKDKLNKMIQDARYPDVRQKIFDVGQLLLAELNCYTGYNYVDWLDGGWEQWKKDGQPDITKYLGDKTKVRFCL